jgi:large exoprotein involved in heme utilization and adhesion
MRNGTITTEALQANGGQIDIRVRDLIQMKDSTIATAVGGGDGDAGNIFIDPKFMVMDNSRIVADAIGGTGGNITIIAGHLFQSPDSLISATSQQSVSGTITVNAPENDVSSAIVLAEPGYLDPTSLLAESCEARSGQTRSSLVRAGRGGLPDDPGRTLHATLVADQLPEELETEDAAGGEGTGLAFLDASSLATQAGMRAGACRR